MKNLYENVKQDELNLPSTVLFSADDAEKIVELIKESGLKCIVNSDEKKTDVTFGIEDIEKLNKILQPIGIEKALNNSAIQLHNVEKKEDLIPIANAMSNLYDRKINGRNSRIKAHQKHIDILSENLNKRKRKAESLKERKVMLSKTAMMFPFFKSPVNALIMRNEKKIERLNNKIPKLEKQIRIHQTTIEALNKSAENYKVRKNACNHLSEVIKSFVNGGKKERNQNYLTALLSLNGDIQQINNDKIKSCIDNIRKLEKNFSELSIVKQQKVQERISNLIKTQNKLAERNKVLQAAQPDISAMLARLNDNKVTERIDKAALIFDQSIAKSNSMSIDTVMSFAAMENSCAVSPTAAEIVQTEVNIISNINDKDGDMIPDKLDSTFDPKVTENSKSQTVKEQHNPTPNVQGQADDEFDAMLKQYHDQIPPNDYPDYFEPDPADITNAYISANSSNRTAIPPKTNQNGADRGDKIMLVTEEQLNFIKQSDIKGMDIRINRKNKSKDGRIPILVKSVHAKRINELLSKCKKNQISNNRKGTVKK